MRNSNQRLKKNKNKNKNLTSTLHAIEQNNFLGKRDLDDSSSYPHISHP